MSTILPPNQGGPTPALSDSSTTPALADSGTTAGGLAAPSAWNPLTSLGMPNVAGALSNSPLTAGTATAVTSAWSKVLTWLGVPSISDVIGMVLGLLLVAAGLFLFKPVHEAAATAVKAAVVA